MHSVAQEVLFVCARRTERDYSLYWRDGFAGGLIGGTMAINGSRSRSQRGTPVLVKSSGETISLEVVSVDDTESEDFLQRLIDEHADCLPLEEIDYVFRDAVAVCRELEHFPRNRSREGFPIRTSCDSIHQQWLGDSDGQTLQHGLA